MDSQINEMAIRLKNDFGWISSMQQFQREQLFLDFHDAVDSTVFFTYHYKPKEISSSLLVTRYWNKLYLSLHYILNSLDKTGVSRYILSYAKDYLHEFSYREAREFRLIEENLLSSLDIPSNAWDKYWELVDLNRANTINKILKLKENYKLNNLIDLEKIFHEGPGDAIPMSPFNWGKATIAGISALSLAVNGFIGFTSPGVAYFSIAAPIFAVSYLAGKS